MADGRVLTRDAATRRDEQARVDAFDERSLLQGPARATPIRASGATRRTPRPRTRRYRA